MWTSDNDWSFTNQSYVDQYYEDTKILALGVNTEEDAVALLKRIKYLQYVSDSYFVPDLAGWEEMALSYIESPATYFKNVQYDILLTEHQNFFKAARILEISVSDGLLPDETLFNMVKEFNHEISMANENCKKYGVISFTEYWFKSKLLQDNYNKWLSEQDSD